MHSIAAEGGSGSRENRVFRVGEWASDEKEIGMVGPNILKAPEWTKTISQRTPDCV